MLLVLPVTASRLLHPIAALSDCKFWSPGSRRRVSQQFRFLRVAIAQQSIYFRERLPAQPTVASCERALSLPVWMPPSKILGLTCRLSAFFSAQARKITLAIINAASNCSLAATGASIL